MSNLVVPHGPQSLLALELSRVRGGEAAKLRYVATHRPRLFPAYLNSFAKQHGHTDARAFMTSALIAHSHRTPPAAKAWPSRTVKPQKPKPRRTK
jgi:hypothetical protein